MAQIRRKIKEREGLKPDNYMAVKLSSQIRSDIVLVKNDAARMRALQAIQARLKPKQRTFLWGLVKFQVKEEVDIKDDIDHRAAVVELISKHIAEVERLSLKYMTNFQASNDILTNNTAAIDGGTLLNMQIQAVTGINFRNVTAAVVRDEIDIDQGVKQIQKQNAAMDAQISKLQEGVVELREVALNMGEELKMQTAVVQELTGSLDMELRQLEDLNAKLQDTIDTAKKNNHILLDVFMVLVIFGLISYLYTLVNPTPACALSTATTAANAAGSAATASSSAASSAASSSSSKACASTTPTPSASAAKFKTW